MKSIIKIFLLNILFATTLAAQEVEYGIASFYSDLFHGKPTASGELYDKGKLTTAHKTLPFGTSLRVTRMDNNKSVVVRVNDRGPFISGRIVELSKEAARQIGLDNDGSARVKVEVVADKAAQEAVTSKTEEKPAAYEEETPAVVKTEPKAAEKATEKMEKKKEEPAKEEKTSKTLAVNEKPAAAKATAKGVEETKAKPAAASTSKAVKVSAKDYQPFDLYQIELKRPEKKGFGVQIAALSTQDALFKKLAELQGDWFDNILVSVEKAGSDDVMYKVILGTFASEGEANIYKANLKKNKKIDGFVVDLANWEKDQK